MQEFCSIVNFTVISTQPISNGPDHFPGGAVVKNPSANARAPGEAGLILGLGRYPGEGNGNLFQYSHLGNPMDRGAWWGTVYGVAFEHD